MIDSCGRKIEYLRISLTDACNLRCIYCMPEKNVKFNNLKSELSNEELLKIIKVFAKLGIKKLRFTGGEPLLNKELDKLIEIATDNGIEKIAITTNGIFLKDRIESLLKSGLTEVNISLDTLNANKFSEITRGGDLNKVLEAIDIAILKGLKVKINVVLIEGVNSDELLELSKISIDKNVDIRFIELMPIGEGKKFKGKSSEEILNILKNSFKIEKTENEGINGPAKYLKIEGAKGRIGFISPMSNKFCKDCNRVRITADGYLKECLHYKGDLNLKELIQNNEDSLEEIVRERIFNKQEEHKFLEEKKSQDNKFMFEIGG